MKTKEIRNFKYGIVDAVEAQSIPPGAASSSLNFLTRGDKVELRRGYQILGTDVGAGGSVSGLGVGTGLDADGTQTLFRTRARMLEYYDETLATPDWVEIGSNTLPVAASGEDFEFDSYFSQAGAQLFGSSPNSSIYKIMVANPGSVTDLASTVYRGYLRIKQSRMFLWNRNAATGSGRADEQNLYLSYIDARGYTTVTAESVGTGDGATKTFAGTLAFKAAGTKRTCFGVTFTDGVETFVDGRDGILSGDAGGTGTINYTTGAYSVTFAVAPLNLAALTSTYQWENSASTGIADFSFSGTRTAGQGNVFLQGDGGPLQGVETYGDTEYCMHLYKAYTLRNGVDDTTAENLLFRDREGVPSHRALRGTSLGVFYVNALDPDNPQLKLMTLQKGSTAIDGVLVSKNVDLSPYVFDRAWVEEWFEYIVVGCRTADSDVNNRLILYSKIWRSIDVVEAYANVGKVKGGTLVLGESITANVVEFFSGVSDDDSAISGYWQGGIWDLEYAGYLKKVKKLQFEGEIGPDQVIDVLVSLDRGPFVTVGQIKGSGDYVDRSQRVDVGSLTMGRGEVGGGSDGVEAYHYFREIPLRLDKFETIELRLETGLDSDNENAEGIGYFSLSLYRPYDIRIKSQRPPRKYRTSA